MEEKNQIREYNPDECVTFLTTRDPFGGYHNMAPGFSININNISIKTSEALYQACRFPAFPNIQKIIIGQKSPMTAKMKSKANKGKTRTDWENVRTKIMRWCLEAKLASNFEKFSTLLLASENLPIVELSKKDAYWGAKPTQGKNVIGNNFMGRLLMELREKLKEKPPEHFLIVEPLNIPDFLLFKEPIEKIDRREIK